MAESESGQEKTEQPSSRRLAKAKEEGQVARSKELTTFAVILLGAILIIVLGPRIASSVFQASRNLFLVSPDVLMDKTEVLRLVEFNVIQVVLSAAPLFVAMFAVGIVASGLIGGVSFSMKALQPQLKRLNPISGLKRMFSAKSLMELFKSLAKFLLVAGVSVWVLSLKLQELIGLSQLPADQAMLVCLKVIAETFLWVTASLIVVVLIDVPFQLWQHNNQLKMTKQEVKEEHKDAEGKPEVKSRIRQMQREMAERRMMDKVPEADIVITNPEHYAVALRYNSARDEAPILLARGQNLVALKIREIAAEHKIEILQAPPLARAIYYSTRLNQQIPAGLYLAVAQALAYVYQMNQFKKGQRVQSVTRPDFPIPEEYRHD